MNIVYRTRRVQPLLLALLLALAACAPAAEVTTTGPPAAPEQPPTTIRTTPAPTAPEVPALVSPAFDPDTVSFSQYDTGRMWTFDAPPTQYLSDTYGLTPDDDWYERARLGALRFSTYCSASFVSPDGLILTNHHCARESITAVTEEGEDLGETGFVAASRDQERAVEDLYVEQLIALFDVTDEVAAAEQGITDARERDAARAQAIERIEARLASERGGEAAGIRAQVVEFYSGARYSAYIYRRYDDIRLVFAPEDNVGFFGGDPDNFTYPRYTLDYTFFRAYGPDGRALNTGNAFFSWSEAGSEEGDLVFVIGNPGSTTRLQTVSELLFRRDVREPAILRLFQTRADVYQAFTEAQPDHPDTPELRDTYFSLSNARKAYTGHVAGLQDDYIIARRTAAERALRQEIQDDPALGEAYADVFDQIAANRAAARDLAAESGAFLGMTPGSATASNVLGRALFAYGFGLTSQPSLRRTALAAEEDRPDELEIALLQTKLEDFLHYFGPQDPVVRQALQGRSPADAARHIFDNTRLRTHEGTREFIQTGNPSTSQDPAIVVARALWPRFASYQQRAGDLETALGDLRGRLARARYSLYGTDIPPDATFTLRINDGVVQGYPYNGTIAPPYTTFWGMYDRHFSHAGTDLEEFFELSERWLPVPEALDLSTPYNFVTTNDIIGGNSGSPMLNRDLEIVGVAFDGNIESLPGDFIYLGELNRTVGVDSRAMIHALEAVYDAAHLARELREAALYVVD
jgi:hypothetical protein